MDGEDPVIVERGEKGPVVGSTSGSESIPRTVSRLTRRREGGQTGSRTQGLIVGRVKSIPRVLLPGSPVSSSNTEF